MTGTPSKDRAEEARDLGLDLMLCTEAEEAILKASHALDKAFAEGMKRAAEIAKEPVVSGNQSWIEDCSDMMDAWDMGVDDACVAIEKSIISELEGR